ncbi:MAG: trypsin-like peptidase domain-containing protein [Acidobacteria bacterium]|nr:trypsin-like peptidase domain-containing protein [Acidobacteriota bacterium]
MLAGTLSPTGPTASAEPVVRMRAGLAGSAPGLLVNFADIAARVNPAVVNIEAFMRPGTAEESLPPGHPPLPKPGGDEAQPGDQQDDQWEESDRGSGSGFLLTPDGEILTNHHVVDGAERLTVKLADGRSLRARIVGGDPDTDVALIKVDGVHDLPVVRLGDSNTLRVGEWVCAIGNPLAYEHTVTVGVVSYLGRKLFDESLDNYIQTDAAINLGNSGGPLINTNGEVIGISAAISSRANNIGFAVPIDQARDVLDQLRRNGRVSRGYIGVSLHDVDEDLQRSLQLGNSRGALVEDVTAGTPAERAGLRRYDLITAVDGRQVLRAEELIRDVAARHPGSEATLRVVRDGRAQLVTVHLTERPPRDENADDAAPPLPPTRSDRRGNGIGLAVEELTRQVVSRFKLPTALSGVVVAAVDPSSPADAAELQHGDVIIEINRKPVRTAAEYRQVTATAQPGDVLTFYLYEPETGQRTLRTLRVEAPD